MVSVRAVYDGPLRITAVYEYDPRRTRRTTAQRITRCKDSLHHAQLRNWDTRNLRRNSNGLPHNPPSTRFAYQFALISFSDVSLCHIEQPENERIIRVKGSVWFKFWRTEPGTVLPKLSDRFPAGAHSYTLYILDWESSIHIVASDVSFSWVEVPQPQT